MKEKVQKVIDEIRPALEADGGNIELVEVGEDGVVKVRLMGACGSCPMSGITMGTPCCMTFPRMPSPFWYFPRATSSGLIPMERRMVSSPLSGS